MKMDRINRILHHPLFKSYMQANAVKEKERIFCRHDMAHAMDVARIAYILYLEQQTKETLQKYCFAEGEAAREIVYAAALLHDIGRHVQYETGEKHAVVSARLAPEILCDAGFVEAEKALLVSAIRTHGDKSISGENNLNGLLARADLLSRDCYSCQAQAACKWTSEEKNSEIYL